MTDYKNIFGKPVKFLSTDPTDAGAEGQVWYNTTSGTFKSIIQNKTFSSGGALNTARYFNSSTGTQTAGLTFGNSPAPTNTATEEYDGAAWTSGGNLNTGRYGGGSAGTQTAGLAFGGGPAFNGATESYNGSTWTTSPATLSTGRGYLSGCGISTAALAFGGQNPPGVIIPVSTEEYNGTAWTAGGNLNLGRTAGTPAQSGTQTAALFYGGNNSGTQSDTQSYNGSTWTTVNSLNTGRYAAAGAGTQTHALAMGNGDPVTAIVEEWDGTNWSTSSASLATARNRFSGAGTGTAALAIGGFAPGASTATEEWNVSIYSPIAATWASGGAYPTSLRQNMSFGTQNLALSVGGWNNTSTVSTSASYDGSTWTATPSLNAAARMGGVAGTQSAGLEFGGIQPGGTYSANMQEWNGSTWADNANNLNTGSYGIVGFGTATAALKAGGENPGGGNYDAVEEYNGSAWTTVTAMPESKYVGAGNGIQTSGLIAGGSPSGTSTLEYNGSTWAAGDSLMTSRPGTQAGSAGTTSDSNIIFGGNAPPGVINDTEGYDGTAWSTRPSLATGRGSTNGNGTASLGLMVCGGPPSGLTTTVEEFTGGSPITPTGAVASTLTTS